MKQFTPIKRFLRRPAVIIGEIAAIGIAGALGAILPEKHIFQSVGFATITSLAAASLCVVVTEQFRRLRSQWRQPPSPAPFQSAPFQMEFERPATGVLPRQKIWSECRLGSAGSLVFHCGLLLLIVAGAWRALFASEAVVDLLEGETLAPNSAWSIQWPGVLGQPLKLDQPLTLKSVSGSRYADGNLRDLRVRFSADEIAVNHQIYFGGSRLYLSQEFGPAALLEWISGKREAVLLVNNGRGTFSGESVSDDCLKVFVCAQGERPASIEVRVMRGSGLLAVGSLGVGGKLSLPGNEQLTLRGAPMWVRLHGSRDSALGLAYAGMILVMVGAAMIFCLIKLDFCVVITPVGEREKVFLALKPQRFAPLFQERFEKLVCEQAATLDLVSGDSHHLEEPEIAKVCHHAAALLMFTTLAFTTGCNRISQADAKKMVERYNEVVSEAYRRSDVRLIDPVVGPNEGRKLTGLIGVRLDLGRTLDSRLLALEVAGVEQARNELRVRTHERWSYRDLKIGSGEQVGEASQDSYDMVYIFTNLNKAWLVDEIKFTNPPKIGRTNAPWAAPLNVMHGLTSTVRKETNQP